MIEYVVKRNGETEEFNAEKLNSMASWAIEAAPEVSWSDIVVTAIRNLSAKTVSAKDLQESLIKTCLDFETPSHNKVAGRLLLGDLRRSTLADQEDFLSFYTWMVDKGYWRDMNYSDEEVEYLGTKIDHDTDLGYGYPTLRQFKDKYCVKDENEVILELPQYMYMGVAMSLFEEDSLEDVVMYYDKASQQKINIPSPVLTGQRTNSNVGVSCVITTAGDSVQGIEATKHIASICTAHSAGMGVEYAVRSKGDTVRKGYAQGGGQLPHLRVLDKLVDEFKQMSRGGSATVSVSCLDPEIETLLNLKLKRTPETKRIDMLDYSLVWNNTFLKYAAKKKDWALVSRTVCPELYEAFDSNDEGRFSEVMEKVLSDESIKKKVVNALDILIQFIDNRDETGRLYRFNHTEVNCHTPFLENVRQSNLCMEICLPTLPYNNLTELYKDVYEEGDGLTAQCFLSAIVLGNVTDDKDYEETAYILAKSLDNLINNMDYPFPQFKATGQGYRSIGVGLSNLAHYLVKSGKTYSDVGFLHDIAERHYYFMLKASVKLAKERGKFEFISKTKWQDGWTPLETYNINLDNVVGKDEEKYDWLGISEEIKKTGVRFSTLVANMPCESSAVLTNSTNSLYPIRQKLVYKSSKKGSIQFFAPDCDKYDYESAYNVEPYTLLNMYGIFQKWADQSTSADTYLDLTKIKGAKVPLTDSIKLQLYGNKIGIKTLYYANTKTGRGDGGADETLIESESDCESCKL